MINSSCCLIRKPSLLNVLVNQAFTVEVTFTFISVGFEYSKTCEAVYAEFVYQLPPPGFVLGKDPVVPATKDAVSQALDPLKLLYNQLAPFVVAGVSPYLPVPLFQEPDVARICKVVA